MILIIAFCAGIRLALLTFNFLPQNFDNVVVITNNNSSVTFIK